MNDRTHEILQELVAMGIFKHVPFRHKIEGRTNQNSQFGRELLLVPLNHGTELKSMLPEQLMNP
jgi:hypothetical protein